MHMMSLRIQILERLHNGSATTFLRPASGLRFTKRAGRVGGNRIWDVLLSFNRHDQHVEEHHRSDCLGSRFKHEVVIWRSACL